eukprot:4515968-Prymnesium_polylepis.1
MVRMQLLDDPDVIFSGYRVSHPLEPAIQLKVQTRNEHVTPVAALQAGLTALTSELDRLEDRFTASLQQKMAQAGQGPGTPRVGAHSAVEASSPCRHSRGPIPCGSVGSQASSWRARDVELRVLLSPAPARARAPREPRRDRARERSVPAVCVYDTHQNTPAALQ